MDHFEPSFFEVLREHIVWNMHIGFILVDPIDLGSPLNLSILNMTRMRHISAMTLSIKTSLSLTLDSRSSKQNALQLLYRHMVKLLTAS